MAQRPIQKMSSTNVLYCYDNPSGRHSRSDLCCKGGPCHTVHRSICWPEQQDIGRACPDGSSCIQRQQPQPSPCSFEAGRSEPSRGRMTPTLRCSSTSREVSRAPRCRSGVFIFTCQRAVHARSLCSASSHVYQWCGSQVATSWAQGPSMISKDTLLALLAALRLLLRS